MPVDPKPYQQLAARRRKQQQALRRALLVLLGIALLIFGLGVLLGYTLGTVHAKAVAPVPDELTYNAQSPQTKYDATITSMDFKETEKPAVIPANLIVSEGNALSPELQKIMQEKCEEYGVPYALALALADQETRFDPDAVSGTNDYGLMQINSINFEWLRERGIDPLTYEGNIEAGVLILSKAINRYGDYGLALMAYNCGDTGAKRLWDAGTYSTKYSREVLERYNKWVQIVEGK